MTQVAVVAPVKAWPDWSGRAVAIVASGPSAKTAGVALLKGRLPVVAIKKCVELAPWADAVYGCDLPWWRSVRGLPDFKGQRWSYMPQVAAEWGGRQVLIPDHAISNALRFDEVGTVGCGGNSGFQALNLVSQMGATRVLLIGFDIHDRGGVHWYGRNAWQGGGNPSDYQFRRWSAAFETASRQLAERGVEVVNASPHSDIRGFRKAGVAETLQAWGL
ncbi:MAG: hypothetical protein KIS90_03985 [Phenylobacterium sp.]|nr:hypothetical protein [Phenylobacterium sp.]